MQMNTRRKKKNDDDDEEERQEKAETKKIAVVIHQYSCLQCSSLLRNNCRKHRHQRIE